MLLIQWWCELLVKLLPAALHLPPPSDQLLPAALHLPPPSSDQLLPAALHLPPPSDHLLPAAPAAPSPPSHVGSQWRMYLHMVSKLC